jgi:hypothetical protein
MKDNPPHHHVHATRNAWPDIIPYQHFNMVHVFASEPDYQF